MAYPIFSKRVWLSYSKGVDAHTRNSILCEEIKDEFSAVITRGNLLVHIGDL